MPLLLRAMLCRKIPVRACACVIIRHHASAHYIDRSHFLHARLNAQHSTWQVAAVIKRCEAQSAAGKGRCSEYEHYIANCIKVRIVHRSCLPLCLISRSLEFTDTVLQSLYMALRYCCH